MSHSDLNSYLESIESAESIRIVETLRDGPYETTSIAVRTDEGGNDTGDPFVLKTIDRSLGEGEAYFALLAAQDAHADLSCIPRLFNVYRTESNVVVEMELVKGVTLEEDLATCKNRLKRTRQAFGRVLEAVGQLHLITPNPVIHRDLKPSNIMVCGDEVKLIDFGAARVYKPERTEDTTHFGTRGYAPPEQFGFGQTTPRSDVYALGMVLGFCLTGRAPNGERAWPEEARRRAPELWRVVDKATELDPDDRYESVWDMAVAFGRACGPNRVGAPAASTAAPAAIASAGAPAASTAAPAASASMPAGRADTRKPLSGLEIAGLVYDIVLVAIWIVFTLVMTLFGLFSPDTVLANGPVWYKLAFSFIVYVIMLGGFVYLVASKKPLYRKLPGLARFTLPRQIIAYAIVFVLCYVLVRALARAAGFTVSGIF